MNLIFARYVRKNQLIILFVTVCVSIVFYWIFARLPFKSWKEEVMLNDGRKITVDQKRRVEGQNAREAWLRIELPEISSESIEWHENLIPLVVNIDKDRLYVIGWPKTDRESRKYGFTKPPYVGFVLENGIFVRIPFQQIPRTIYATNMLIDDFPPAGTNFLSISDKNSPIFNGRRLMPASLLRIDPDLGCFC